MKSTRHSSIRSQQRGIPPLVVDLLIKFGCRQHDQSGAEILYFDRRARKRIESYVGGLIGRLNEHLDSYVVVDGEQIITAGIRYKHIKG